MLCNNTLKLDNTFCYFFLPDARQKTLESLIKIISQIITNNLSKNNEKYFPIITILFMFILLENLSELIPYSVIRTSHLIITFTLLFFIFIRINILTVKKYKLEIFSLFMSANPEHFYSSNSLQVKNTLKNILEFLLLNISFPIFVGVVLITLIFF